MVTFATSLKKRLRLATDRNVLILKKRWKVTEGNICVEIRQEGTVCCSLRLLSGKDFSDSRKDVIALFSERKVQASHDGINRDSLWKKLGKIRGLHV